MLRCQLVKITRHLLAFLAFTHSKEFCFRVVSLSFIQVASRHSMYHVEMTKQIMRMSRCFKVCCITLIFSQICGAVRDLQAHPVVLGKKICFHIVFSLNSIKTRIFTSLNTSLLCYSSR